MGELQDESEYMGRNGVGTKIYRGFAFWRRRRAGLWGGTDLGGLD